MTLTKIIVFSTNVANANTSTSRKTTLDSHQFFFSDCHLSSRQIKFRFFEITATRSQVSRELGHLIKETQQIKRRQRRARTHEPDSTGEEPSEHHTAVLGTVSRRERKQGKRDGRVERETMSLQRKRKEERETRWAANGGGSEGEAPPLFVGKRWIGAEPKYLIAFLPQGT